MFATKIWSRHAVEGFLLELKLVKVKPAVQMGAASADVHEIGPLPQGGWQLPPQAVKTQQQRVVISQHRQTQAKQLMRLLKVTLLKKKKQQQRQRRKNLHLPRL